MSGWTRSEGTGDLKEVGLPRCISDLQNIRWWFDVFVSKLPGPLTMHITAFTGLYIIAGCLGKP
jgi:hypothetical protein